MHWNIMTAQERNALVAEVVFGRSVYKEDTWGNWMLHVEGKPGLLEMIPSYSQSFDAAWPIFARIATYRTKDGYDTSGYFADTLFEEITMGSEIYPNTKLIPLMAEWTPEILCQAALQTFGVFEGSREEEEQGQEGEEMHVG